MTENSESRRERTPLAIGVMLILGIIVVGGLVGFLISNVAGPKPGDPQDTPDPLSLELPLTFGEYSRDPNAATAAPMADSNTKVRSATYLRAGKDSLFVLVSQPVKSPTAMLQDAPARAIREMGDDSACGRNQQDQDVCVTMREDVGVLVVALQDQTPEQILAAAKQLATELKRPS